MVFLLDQASHSLYEFDTGRGRFLGPALNAYDNHTLYFFPGDNFLTGDALPQDACTDGSYAAVATGRDGGITVFRVGDAGLSPPAHIDLPSVLVQPSPPRIRGPFMDPSTLTLQVVCLGNGKAVGISRDEVAGTSSAYVVDMATGQLVASGQLPGHITVAATHLGDELVTGTNDKRLFLIHSNLHVDRELPDVGYPTHIAVVGHSFVVTTGEPVKFVVLSLDTGSAHAYSSTQSIPGPLAPASDQTSFWSGDSITGNLEKIGLDGTVQWREDICPGIHSIADIGTMVLIACASPPRFAILMLPNGHVTLSAGGGDPWVIALPPGIGGS